VRFRPCIDLHNGQVKQIVGGSLRDAGEGPVTNFVASQPPEYFADLYWRDGLEGGHVIKLGPGNDAAARAALGCHPGSLQVGGGITGANAAEWLDAGAGKVIVTSHLFIDGELSEERLRELVAAVGAKRLVLDLSCRARDGEYYVVCDRWQTFTKLRVTRDTLGRLAESCSEFLIHGVDVEGMQSGIEKELVQSLGEWAPAPITYAGGIATEADVELMRVLGQGRLDITVGSALDIFGGQGLRYAELVDMDRQARSAKAPPA
jgi:phosphoribosylformimino-5-aminoimidazole carboxamide ribotide isomerase